MSTVSIVLAADHGSLRLSRMEGVGGTEYKVSAEYIRDRHSQAGVKDFGEMSSVSIVVLSELRWGRIEARKKKKHRPNMEL